MERRNTGTEWAQRLREFIPSFLHEHPVLSRVRQDSAVILYGSTTIGVDDEFSDLDLWLLVPDHELALLDSQAGTRFFEIAVAGKKGHLTAKPAREFEEEVLGCQMDTIRHLRNGAAIVDPAGSAAELIRLARLPMTEEVRRAFFFYHYVEMRGEHPACRSPMERGDPIPVLLTVPKMLGHAMRAAMVLDGEPYPSDKWLFRAASSTPTGRLVCLPVQRFLDLLSADMLRFAGPRKDNPIDRELKVLRQILIDAAEAHGVREPWLTEWWLHMHRTGEAIRGVRWQGPVEPREREE